MSVEVAHDQGRGPGLVYVPGIDGTGELLLGTRARLARHFRLLCLRYPPSPLPPVEGGYAELAAGVRAAIGRAGLERPLLLAESFGVAVALATALEHPEAVRGLALVNGFAHFRSRGSLALTRAVAPFVPGRFFRWGRRLTVQRGLLAPRRDDAALAALLALEGPWFDRAYRRRLALIAALDLRPRLGGLELPVDLYASTDDRVVPALEEARELERVLPRARLTVVPRAGHLILPLAEEPWEERLLDLDRIAEPRP